MIVRRVPRGLALLFWSYIYFLYICWGKNNVIDMKNSLYLRCLLWVATMLVAGVSLYGQEVKNYPSRVGYPTYWGQRYTQFAALGTESTDIVMMGDDFMDRGIWNEFFEHKNTSEKIIRKMGWDYTKKGKTNV